MALATGTRLGAYEVLALIGAGGMGEVYRAHDPRLNRDVALKILPPEFAVDAERLGRFRREAQVLASLNHPNIAAIYGVEESQGLHALVLELVEGPTLADRIAEGALPLDDALPLARQIAEALVAAHEHGVIHRDLKPANIKLRPDGTVKVLDFGLAKAMAADSSSPRATALSLSPTITSPAATRVGVILGTAAYMSPEQARGKTTDRRTDIWAFGCVVYEMVTGRRAFDGEDVTDVLARVLERDADLSTLDGRTPAPLRRLLRRCFEKDPKRRLPDIGVALLEIDEAMRGEPIDTVPPTAATPASRAWIAVAALVAGLLVGAAAMRFVPTPADSIGSLRLQIDTPRGNVFTGRFAVSPDGRSVIFQSPRPGLRQMRLWLRHLAEETAQEIPGTEDASGVTWSPDARSIAFTVRSELKRLELSDGRTQTLATPAASAGGAWSNEGGIIFATSFAGPLYRVAPTGGDVTTVTRIDPPRTSGHVFPQFLPGGRKFLYYAFGSPDGEGIYLGSLDSPDARRLVRTDSAGIFVPPDRVVFDQEGSLVARRLNLASGVLEADTMTVAPDVASDIVNGFTAVSSGGSRTIAYRSRPEQRQLVWLDRAGRQMGTLASSDSGQPGVPRISPDGGSILLSRTENGNTDIWLIDAIRGTRRPLTRDPAADFGAVWSPDGKRIVFQSDRRAGNLDLYEKVVDGAEEESVLLQDRSDKNVYDWSSDGRYILYRNVAPGTGSDIWALPLFGARTPISVTRTAANEQNARLSPDGRWVAYQSNETGRSEIFVQAFPDPGSRRQASIDGGFSPEWRGDSGELFFTSPDEQMMSVTVRATGTMLQLGTPVALFAKPEGPYAVSADGMRFLVGMVSADGSPITILLNWPAGRE